MAIKKKKKSGTSVIRIAAREASLKRRFRRHLRGLGFVKRKDGFSHADAGSKDVVRALHSAQRDDKLRANEQFIAQRTPDLIKHFATGAEIDPAKVAPELERISSGTWQSDLFRLASLTWSVPVSSGFGRRLRYLVWDRQNEKLIGLIAIGDPVFNLAVRDNTIKWNVRDREERLVNLMDAYVLGAVPPYNMLLGGKMVACLLRSRDIYDDFMRAYGSTTGIISKRKKKARLLAITTSSSMGRSAVYNRLKLGGVPYFSSVGYTSGWGHFHIPDDLFAELRDYLRKTGHTYADLHRFGQGPNWRLRATRAALTSLGFDGHMLRHGIKREVLLCTLAANAFEILRTGKGRPDLSGLLAAPEVAKLAIDRWLIPRADRKPEYKLWTVDQLTPLLATGKTMPAPIAKSG